VAADAVVVVGVAADELVLEEAVEDEE